MKELLINFAYWFDTYRDLPKGELLTHEDMVNLYLHRSEYIKAMKKEADKIKNAKCPVCGGELTDGNYFPYWSQLCDIGKLTKPQ